MLITNADDLEEREEFNLQHGDFLPSDIYPALNEQPIRYAIQAVKGYPADATATIEKPDGETNG